MKVKIADWIAQYLVDQGIKYNFTVPGGGAMHLNVSFGHQEGLTNILSSMSRVRLLQRKAIFVQRMNCRWYAAQRDQVEPIR